MEAQNLPAEVQPLCTKLIHFWGMESTYFTSYIVEIQSKRQWFSDYQKFFSKAYTSAVEFHY